MLLTLPPQKVDTWKVSTTVFSITPGIWFFFLLGVHISKFEILILNWWILGWRTFGCVYEELLSARRWEFLYSLCWKTAPPNPLLYKASSQCRDTILNFVFFVSSLSSRVDYQDADTGRGPYWFSSRLENMWVSPPPFFYWSWGSFRRRVRLRWFFSLYCTVGEGVCRERVGGIIYNQSPNSNWLR